MRASVWIGVVAERLAERWPTIDAARLEDVAGELWADAHLRELDPQQAADEWLRPVACSTAGPR